MNKKIQYFVGSLVSQDRIVSNDLRSKQSVCNASVLIGQP